MHILIGLIMAGMLHEPSEALLACPGLVKHNIPATIRMKLYSRCDLSLGMIIIQGIYSVILK